MITEWSDCTSEIAHPQLPELPTVFSHPCSSNAVRCYEAADIMWVSSVHVACSRKHLRVDSPNKTSQGADSSGMCSDVHDL